MTLFLDVVDGECIWCNSGLFLGAAGTRLLRKSGITKSHKYTPKGLFDLHDPLLQIRLKLGEVKAWHGLRDGKPRATAAFTTVKKLLAMMAKGLPNGPRPQPHETRRRRCPYARLHR